MPVIPVNEVGARKESLEKEGAEVEETDPKKLSVTKSGLSRARPGLGYGLSPWA
jgi:hypothetical protein